MTKNQMEHPTAKFPAGPAYLVAVLLLVMPTLDVVLGLGELQFDVLHWRFGAVGLLSGVLVLPILGSFGAVAVAHSCGHVGMRRVFTLLNGSAALVLLAMLALFVLDGLQLRQQVVPQARGMYDVNLAKASVTLLVSVIAFGWLCVGSIRIALRARSQAEKRVAEKGGDPLLVVAAAR